MGLPPSVTKPTKNGVEFTTNVDLAQYLIHELIRGANRDIMKTILKIARNGMPKKTGRARKAIQAWNKKDGTLVLGFKSSKGVGFYARFYETGTAGGKRGKKGGISHDVPKIGMLTNAVEQNIDLIQEIQGKYLSAIEDKNKASALIDEAEDITNDG